MGCSSRRGGRKGGGSGGWDAGGKNGEGRGKFPSCPLIVLYALDGKADGQIGGCRLQRCQGGLSGRRDVMGWGGCSAVRKAAGRSAVSGARRHWVGEEDFRDGGGGRRPLCMRECACMCIHVCVCVSCVCRRFGVAG
eukprot:366335-Chlamydomonas_euryale.AAC.7